MPIPAGAVPVNQGSLVGKVLDGRYRLLDTIGDGGMGRVYRAEQVSTGRTVALKVLHSEFSGVAEAVQRFEREAALTTKLSHPHIVKTVDFGKWDGRLYLAMELLTGGSLADLLDANRRKTGGRLTVTRAIAIMRPVLAALEYAHGLGVVHRDLKPENIMVVPARGVFARECVKLLDFGIAKLGESAEVQGRKLTQVGLVLGTPGYMSPEQAAGQVADVRSDLYGCGVLLYEMLAGRRPFEAPTTLEVLGMHLSATPKPLREIAGEAFVPPQLEEVVMRALEKRPADRFQTARELRDALDRVPSFRSADAIISGVETTIFAPPVAAPSRSGWMRSAIVALAMALLIGEHLGAAAPPSASGRRVASVGRNDVGKTQGRPEQTDAPKTSGEHDKQATRHGAKRSAKLKKSSPKKDQKTSNRKASSRKTSSRKAPKQHPPRAS
jgi:serine/threonine protein kinase